MVSGYTNFFELARSYQNRDDIIRVKDEVLANVSSAASPSRTPRPSQRKKLESYVATYSQKPLPTCHRLPADDSDKRAERSLGHALVELIQARRKEQQQQEAQQHLATQPCEYLKAKSKQPPESPKPWHPIQIAKNPRVAVNHRKPMKPTRALDQYLSQISTPTNNLVAEDANSQAKSTHPETRQPSTSGDQEALTLNLAQAQSTSIATDTSLRLRSHGGRSLFGLLSSRKSSQPNSTKAPLNMNRHKNKTNRSMFCVTKSWVQSRGSDKMSRSSHKDDINNLDEVEEEYDEYLARERPSPYATQIPFNVSLWSSQLDADSNAARNLVNEDKNVSKRWESALPAPQWIVLDILIPREVSGLRFRCDGREKEPKDIQVMRGTSVEGPWVYVTRCFLDRDEQNYKAFPLHRCGFDGGRPSRYWMLMFNETWSRGSSIRILSPLVVMAEPLPLDADLEQTQSSLSTLFQEATNLTTEESDLRNFARTSGIPLNMLDRIAGAFSEYDAHGTGFLDYAQFAKVVQRLLTKGSRGASHAHENVIPEHRIEAWWNDVNCDETVGVKLEDVALWYISVFESSECRHRRSFHSHKSADSQAERFYAALGRHRLRQDDHALVTTEAPSEANEMPPPLSPRSPAPGRKKSVGFVVDCL